MLGTARFRERLKNGDSVLLGTEERGSRKEQRMASLTALLVPGVVGVYTHFEATEVIAIRNGNEQAINVFTLLVAENRGEEAPQAFQFLNPKPLRCKSAKRWTFGVSRYTCLISELAPALIAMDETGDLSTSGNELRVGRLRALPSHFVPPDSLAHVPWNKVLKNNFWNGSHVFEWSDTRKNALSFLFEAPRSLQELSVQVAKFVPIDLAGLSDRIGNVAIQLPVTAVMCGFKLLQSNEFEVEVAWHPKVKPRKLRASCERTFDQTIAYASTEVPATRAVVPTQGHRGIHRGVLWDESHQVVLAATGEAAFITSLSTHMGLMTSEPRVFFVTQADGTTIRHDVALTSSATTWKTFHGDSETDDTGGRTRGRIYQSQVEQLARQRTFVQYRPGANGQDDGHRKAISDLRHLLSRYGQEGAWLWDPYLSADDILETLFFCPYADVDLRALTSGGEAKQCQVSDEDSGLSGKRGFIERQRDRLTSVQSNWLGLRLEYRARIGPSGFGFHDRFLIFPNASEGALAWSLGTSVNSLGKAHHILQRVDNGQLVRDAFVELWDELDGPEHLIWKKPCSIR